MYRFTLGTIDSHWALLARVGGPSILDLIAVGTLRHSYLSLGHYLVLNIHYLPPEVARGAYSHGRDVFFAMYLPFRNVLPPGFGGVQ